MPKASVVPKREPLAHPLEEQILTILKASPQGLSNNQIFDQIPSQVAPNIRAAAYNKLLAKGRLRLAKRQIPGATGKSASEVIYQFVSAEEAIKFRGLDGADRMVYDVIRAAKEDGISRNDIKYRTNIQNGAELRQILDKLLQRKLVKEIKSVQGSKKSVYILSELDPSPQLTGGPWYNDEQEFDTEFIDAVYNQVHAYMKKRPYVSVEQVTNYISDIKLSNETLTQDNVRQLMRTMLYDGIIEEFKVAEGVKCFRVSGNTPSANQLTSVPCGTCPIFKSCVPGGVISPERCVYMTEWLKSCVDW